MTVQHDLMTIIMKEGTFVAFIPLNCPNCNGKIEYKKDEVLKCPYCETELLLKQNHVYYVDQTINHYHGTPPKAPLKQTASVKVMLILMLVLTGAIGTYFYYSNRLHLSKNRSQSAFTKDA